MPTFFFIWGAFSFTLFWSTSATADVLVGYTFGASYGAFILSKKSNFDGRGSRFISLFLAGFDYSDFYSSATSFVIFG